jgi:hypothetical protein
MTIPTSYLTTAAPPHTELLGPIPMPSPMQPLTAPESLVGSASICSHYRITRRTLGRWLKLDLFPKPDYSFHDRYRWKFSTVCAYDRSRAFVGRQPK